MRDPVGLWSFLVSVAMEQMELAERVSEAGRLLAWWRHNAHWAALAFSKEVREAREGRRQRARKKMSQA